METQHLNQYDFAEHWRMLPNLRAVAAGCGRDCHT